MSPSSNSSNNMINDVVLNVYKLQVPEQQQQSSSGMKGFLSSLTRFIPNSIAAYHTSITFQNYTYTFVANVGIVPRRGSGQAAEQFPPDSGCTFVESITLGFVSNDSSMLDPTNKVGDVVERLQKEFFTPTSYHMVHRNCNHFTETFATALLLADDLVDNPNKTLDTYPSHINRLANTGQSIISTGNDTSSTTTKVVTCNPTKEALKVVDADKKVGWSFGSSNNNKKTNKKKSTKKDLSSSSSKKQPSNQKKELTEKQKALLAKMRKK